MVSETYPGAMYPAVVLAGGLSRRMGGGDKGLLPLAGRPMLAHVIARLIPQAGPLAINANGDPSRFAGFGLPVLPDGIAGFAGPLAGVLAAMDWAAARQAGAVVTVAADTPFFPADLVARLAGAGQGGLAIAATEAQGRVWPQPTFGLWPVGLRHDLRAALEGGLRKVTDWTTAQGAALAVMPVAGTDPFFNVNTPEDLALAEAMLRDL